MLSKLKCSSAIINKFRNAFEERHVMITCAYVCWYINYTDFNYYFTHSFCYWCIINNIQLFNTKAMVIIWPIKAIGYAMCSEVYVLFIAKYVDWLVDWLNGSYAPVKVNSLIFFWRFCRIYLFLQCAPRVLLVFHVPRLLWHGTVTTSAALRSLLKDPIPAYSQVRNFEKPFIFM